MFYAFMCIFSPARVITIKLRDANQCACTTRGAPFHCRSLGVDVRPMCGCEVFERGARPICYVGEDCPGAWDSTRFPGAKYYGDCEIASPPPPHPHGCNDPLGPFQWHLRFVRATSAMTRFTNTGHTKATVPIVVVDDGMDLTFRDVSILKNRSFSWSKNGTMTPHTHISPTAHGTNVAATSAAITGNDFAGCGIASGAPIIAVQLLQTSTNEEWMLEENFNSTLQHFFDEDVVLVNSWGPPDDGRISTAQNAHLANFGNHGRRGKGGIVVFAAGNGGQVKDNVNDDGFASDPYVIAVSSIGDDDRFTSYAEVGSCILLVAPSSGGWRPGIRLVDITNHDAEVAFTGTSAAAPLVAGTISLVLTLRPDLHRRDVRRILIESARVNDPLDEKWVRNAAGRHFHPFYGFGALDVEAAVHTAEQWPYETSEEVTACSQWWRGNVHLFNTEQFVAVPPLKKKVEFTEVASLFLSITHPARQHLRVTLTSPQGTESVVIEEASEQIAQPAFQDHWYHINAFDGEIGDAFGWKVKLKDTDNTGMLRGVRLCLRGRTATYAEPSVPKNKTHTHKPYGYLLTGTLITVASAILVFVSCRVQSARYTSLRSP